MPTVDDLRAVFAEIEASAPSELREPERVLTRPRRRPRRLIAAAAAAIVVIGVGVGVGVTRGGDSPEPRPANPKPTPAVCPTGYQCPVLNSRGGVLTVPTHYTLGLAGRYTVMDRELTPKSETLAIANAGIGAHVSSFAAGSALPESLARGAAADVPGHRAYYASTPGAAVAPRSGAAEPAQTDIITWTEGARTIVVFSKSHVLRVARAVRFADTRQSVALPFRLDKLPRGVVPDRILVIYSQGKPQMAIVGFTDGKPVDQNPSFVGYKPSFGQPGRDALTVEIAPAQASSVPGRVALGSKVGGHPAYATYGGHQLFVPLSDGYALQAAPDPSRMSTYNARYFAKLAQDMTLAPDPADASTWFTSHLFP